MTTRQTRRHDHFITNIGMIHNAGEYVELLLLETGHPVRVLFTPTAYEELARQIALGVGRPAPH